MKHVRSALALLLMLASLTPIQVGLAQPPASVWEVYHDHERLTAALEELSQLYPNLITYESAGKSVQGREIWLATITNRDLPGERPTVLFDGAMHGSEVIGSESMLYYIRFLVTQYDFDAVAREIVDNWITYVIPMVNPDGVENGKSSSDYRAARKNANLANPSQPQTGVDLNRNFDWEWPPPCPSGCQPGCTASCFAHPGASAFSEPESSIIRDEIINRRVPLYLNAHAGEDFEQLIRPGLQLFEGGLQDPHRQRHIAIQECIQKLTPFQSTAGTQAGAAKNWTYAVPMKELRDAGHFPTLSFNLEIYTISEIQPGFGNPYWWCRYNPPAAEGDEVWEWCRDGTGYEPTDTLGSRMEKVKTTLIYITQSSTTELPACPAQSVTRVVPASVKLGSAAPNALEDVAGLFEQLAGKKAMACTDKGLMDKVKEN